VFRGIASGLALGLCIAAADAFLGGRQMMRMNMPPMLEPAVQAALLEIALGGLFGLLLSPLRMLWRGGIVHALAIASAWIALARHVALDPANTPSWLMAPAVGLGVFVLGALVAGRSRVLAWGLGVVAADKMTVLRV
jgi:hypothetical protein